MRTADTILGLIRERGKKGLPLERVYKLLFNRDLYLMAYGKIYRNAGAMTHGVTEETPDGMSLAKIDTLIEALRYERFDRLDHELLLSTLSEQIHDGRFIRLMRELLDAGYMEDWTYNETLSGVPQGGIVSPILSNILLDKLDTFVEHTLIPQYTRGTARKVNLEYRKLLELSRRTRRQGNTEEAERLRSEAQKLPSQVTDDPDYRRLNYVRYADDFLLGFIGPKSEAETIKQQLKTFLREELKLELSEEKTLITHARSEAARFLGYEITRLHNDEQRTKRATTQTMCRTINHIIGFRVPKDVIEAKRQRYMREEGAVHRAELLERSDYDIVMTYQLEYRGIANYYQLAHNVYHLNKLKWTMETSLTKTLASKHQMSVTQVYEKYGTTLTVQGKKYNGLQVRIPREEKHPLVATWGGIPLKRDMKATLEERPPQVYGNRTELVQRLLADFCELCGSEEDVEVHHERAMRKLHEHPGRPKPEWVKRMIALRRKTLLLCRRCHEAVEYGLPITWTLLTLKEVKAQRSARMTAIPESRVQ